MGLRLHEAGSRISELCRYAHDGSCIVASAVLKIGCGCNRADENERRQHPQTPVYRAAELIVVGFAGRACSAILERGVKTAT